jgi:hypothetical protein
MPTDHTDPPAHPRTQRHGDAEGISLDSSVRRGSRPSKHGRESLGRKTASNASVRHGFPTQRPALSKSAGLASSLLHSIDGRDTPPFPTMKEKGGRTSVPPISGTSFQAQHPRLCAFAFLSRSLRISAPPRLCDSAFLFVFSLGGWRFFLGGGICVFLRDLRFLRVSGSVFICVICGQSGIAVGGWALCDFCVHCVSVVLLPFPG